MFFRKSEHKKRKHGGGILGIFRVFVSLFMICLLLIGGYLAFKQFSGYDPLKLDPKGVLKELITSEGAVNLITGLLSANPPSSLDEVKGLLGEEQKQTGGGKSTSNAPVIFKYAIIADSHKDSENLRKAINQARAEGAEFVVGMGDFSDVGTIEELQATKGAFEGGGIPFYLTPGDHDLWDSRDKKNSAEKNFSEIFGTPYQSFSFKGARFIIVFNSDNYVGLDSIQLKWVEDEVNRNDQEKPKVTFAFAATPFYHPSSDHIMGKETPKLKNQAEHLTSVMQKGGVDEVFFADTHFATRYAEPKTSLKMMTIGAVTSIKNPQAPRFVMVDVRDDGSYNVREVEIK